MGLARTAGRPAGSHCVCIGSIFWGKRKKYFGVQTRPGGWGGSSDHQNKTAPEPPAAPEPLVLQNKTAPEPPLPYFGGSTSKKTAPEPPLPILLRVLCPNMPQGWF